MVTMGAVILSSFWTFAFPLKTRLISLYVLNLVLSLLIFADLVYYRYFEDLISTSVLFQAGQVQALGDSITALFAEGDWLFFIDVLIFLPFVIYFSIVHKGSKTSKRQAVSRLVMTVIVFYIGFTLLSVPVKSYIERGGGYLFEKAFLNMRVYNVLGLLGYHGFDVYRYVKGNVLSVPSLSRNEEMEIFEWFEEKRFEQLEKSPFSGSGQGKNVILVQMEAFEKFVIDRKINGQEITPHLNELKKESMYFNRFFHQTYIGRTSDAEFLVQTSLHPLSSGAVYMLHPNNFYTALPLILRENGYQTAAFHAYNKSFWNRYIMYPTLGFETFHSIDSFTVDEKLGWSLSDESMLKQAYEKITQLKEPFYAFLVTLTSHHPYSYIPPEYQTLNLNGIENELLKDYLHSVHYVDKALGEFISLLKESGLWDTSVVIFYGDHESRVLDGDEEVDHVLALEEKPLKYNKFSNQVPLFIHLPNDEGAGVYDKVGGQIDLGPTILDILGVDSSQHYMMGTSLFQDERMVVFRKGSFTTDKYFYEAPPEGMFENGRCFDLAKGIETDVEACRGLYEKGQKELEVSDSVLKGDLIKKWIKDGAEG